MHEGEARFHTGRGGGRWRLRCKSGGAGEVGDPTALTERGENVTESESVDGTGHPTV